MSTDNRPAEPPAGTGDPAANTPPVSGPELARAALARVRERGGGGRQIRVTPEERGQAGAAPTPPIRSAAQRAASMRAAGLRAARSAARREKGLTTDPGPDPAPLGGLLQEFVRIRGWEAEVAVASVHARWPTLVGPDIAAHCAPVTLRDGELTVTAESTAWATQLRLLAHDLQRRISSDLGPGVVRRVYVRGPTAPSWGRGRLRVRGAGPRDTYG